MIDRRQTTGPTGTIISSLYPDAGMTMIGGTPLVTSGFALFSPMAILTYERMIFGLQQEILRYKALLDQALSRTELPEPDLRQPVKISSSGGKALRRILAARIDESSLLRDSDEDF